MYQVFIKDTVHNLLWEMPHVNFSFTDELNNGKSAQFGFEYETLKAVADAYNTTYVTILGGGFREIWVEKNGIKIYYGAVTDINEASDQETEQVTISVASVGFFNLLDKRRTNNKRVFSSTDAGTIAWTLINESQTSDSPYSDLGITMGTIATSISRDRTFRFDNVKTAITKLSNTSLSNGFDFEIDNNKQLQISYPQKGSVRPEIVFDEKNILNWSRIRPSILSLTNKIYVIGSGSNDDVLYSTRISDPTYRAVFGTLEDVYSEKDVIDSTTLDATGDRFLLENQSPLETFNLTHLDDDPDVSNYGLGDSVVVTISKLGIASQNKRIIKRVVACSGEDMALVTLTLK